MSNTEKLELRDSTVTFVNFIMNLFLTSESIFDVFVSKSKEIIYSSAWKDEYVITDLVNKWLNNEIPSTLSIQGMKFIKLHDSPFNLIYRSIQNQKALIGAKFPISGEEIQAFALVTQTSTMQLQSTALKDITNSIIGLGQKATSITIVDPNSIHVNISLLENKQTITIFIESLKHMHFLCEYKDKGDEVVFNLQYKKEEKKVYSDEVYKQYMK